jgi:transcriptional regulator with XRE-family HTH domain
MKFKAYVSLLVKSEKTTKTKVLEKLAEQSGISLLTLQHVERGSTLKLYDKAKKLSEATNGRVKISDLCEDAEA